MSQHECKKCGETKSAGDMIARNGKPSRLCRACFGLSFSNRKKKGGGVRKTEKTLATVVEKVTRRKREEPQGHAEALQIEQSYGCRASWQDGYLHVEQDQVDDAGTTIVARLILTRSDLSRLTDWVG